MRSIGFDISGCGETGAALLLKRFERAGLSARADAPHMVRVKARDDDDVISASAAVADHMLRDMAYPSIGDIVDMLPFELSAKQAILADAVRIARVDAPYTATRRAAAEYLRTADVFPVKAFLTFRMKDEAVRHEAAVARAAQEYMIRTECMELMGLLRAFMLTQPCRAREISVILHPDGKCTITDETGARIDCKSVSGEGVMSMLVSLAPERVVVYDLSMGAADDTAAMLTAVFEDRVRLFR